MKRYLKYIFLALTATFMAASCIEEMQFDQPFTQSDELTLVPRVRNFANQYVTKADYSSDETRITSLSVLIFNSDGDLVHVQSVNGNKPVTLNKSMLKISGATVVMFANVSLDQIRNAYGNSIAEKPGDVKLSNLDSYIITNNQPIITDLAASDGLPMMGRTDNVDLTPTSEQQAAIEVPLNILYAKVKFAINVAPGTENQGTGSFDLNSFSVFNAATTTNVAAETFATAASTYTAEGTTIPADDLTFYISENRYSHNSDLMGIYPDNGWLTSVPSEDVKDYKSPDDDSRLNGVKYFYDDIIQQYKPKLADKGAGKATYALLSGTYTDYRGTVWDVRYTIYLGKDNAINFHVDRNSEYTNNITIKGIRNNDSYGEDQVWIDHRVDVSASTDNAAHVTITRETLIDAHFEVRPLRVKLPDNIDRVLLYLPKYNGVQITETKTGTNENWIAVENNNGRVKDITQYSANGKRKYFTASLIKQLYLENTDEIYGIRTNLIDGDDRKGQKYIQLFDGDCAWIYIDENVNGGEREATIELVFYDIDGNVLEVETFKIKQQGLHTTASGVKIENYEEYLHTYDSQDLYTNPLTDYTQQGYKWGLEGINLSENQNVVLTGDSSSDKFYYDFFHSKDREYSNAIGSVGTYEVVGGNIADNHGLNFTNNAGISNEMTIIDMNTRPSSAIQYCLSKNKFKVDDSDAEKHTMDVHWYLPDVYEMTQILTDSKSTFSDFGQYAYWTSQPSWKTPTDILGLNYLVDDVDNARAVSIEAANTEKYTGTNASRDNHYRIRCAYSAEGIKNVDFSGTRAPEGIGAMRFYMRAWKDWDSKEKGYFSWDGVLEQEEDPVIAKYTLPETYAFPINTNDANKGFGNFLNGYGFELDPSDEDNWEPDYGISYPKLNTFPGLTTSQVITRSVNIPVVGTITAYTLEGTKEETKGTTTTYSIEYKGNIVADNLKPLDHLYSGTDLNIKFATGTDATHSPVFQYKKIQNVVSVTTNRRWKVPKYIPKENPNESTDYLLEESGYSYKSESEAKTAGENKVKSTYSAYTTAYVETDSQWQVFRTRYKYIIKYKDYKKYYSYESGGHWVETDNGIQNTPNNNPPTDQLVMYGGNSFTITANNDNEITSVKIYFSGSNVVDELGTGKDYLRFTKDGFTGGSDQNPPGMTYSGDGNTGTMTWNGDPQTELTFKLVLLRKTYGNLGLWGDPTSFQYISNNNDSKAESIVIDQIDVRYKKKSTIGQ